MQKHLVEDENAIRADIWRAWEKKGKRHDIAIARKMKMAASVIVAVIVLVLVCYLLATR